ncbi:MAG TPA: ABC transporter substrate-binding protein [bacterium]|nr:ABC transporter substrate-binding protein [bacterium]
MSARPRRGLSRRELLRLVPGAALGATGALRPATPPAASAAAAAPRRGGTFKIPITANVTPWPPIGLIQNLMVNKSMFNGLVRYSPVDWTPQPDLAETWEISKDGLAWTFHLRKGVVWHDGRPFTADDVKFSLDLYADPKVNSILQGNLEPVAGIEAVNPTTVKVVTKQPYSSLIELLCYLTFMMPKHLLAGQEFSRTKFPDAFIRHPVGTGPFKFGEHIVGDHFTVVANDHYHEGRPYLDSVIYKVVRDLNSTVVQVKTGELDIAFPTVAQLPALESASNLYIIERGLMDYRFLGLNHTDPKFGKWFRDKRVRQALAYAINAKGIIGQVAKGRADRSNGPLPPALKAWFVKGAPVFEYDPDKAKRMLGEVGFKPGPDGVLAKDGEKFSFAFFSDQGQPEREQTSLIVQQNLKDIGVDAQFQTLEFNNFMQRERVTKEFSAVCFYYVTPATPDLHSYWQTGGSTNEWSYSNPEVDRMFRDGLSIFDPEKRREHYRKLYTLLAEEQPVVYIYHPHELQAVSKKVRGWARTDYRDALLYLNQVWVEA